MIPAQALRRPVLRFLHAPGGLHLAALLLFALVVAGRVVFVSLYAESIPFWDQWDAEGMQLLKPWVEGRLQLADLFAAHNEHRILLTRLLSLALFEANGGQWDNLVSAYANTAVYAAVPTALFLALAPGLAWRSSRGVLFLALLALALLPYAWENTRVGFQSQFYFMSLLAIATLWLASRMQGPRQFAATAATATLGLFTMASGVLAPVAAGGLLCLRAWIGDARLRSVVAAILVLAAIAVLGLASIPHIAPHDVYRAQGLGELLARLLPNLGWPLAGNRWTWLLVWFPTATSLWRLLRHRQADPREVFALGVAAWALLQLVAISYSRDSLSSRYLDTVALGVVANLWLGLGLLEAFARRPRPAAGVQAGVALLASLACVVALARALPSDLATANAQRELSGLQVAHVRAFMSTGDIAHLHGKRAQAIPYPDAGRLAGYLADPTLRAILPPSIRAPLDAATALARDTVEAHEDEQGRRVSTCPAAADCVQPRGQWSSMPMRSRLPYVYLPLKVYGDGTGLAVSVDIQGGAKRELALEGSGSARHLAPVRPGTPFTLTLDDSSAEGGIALRPPVETGRLGALAMALQDRVRQLFGHPGSDALQRDRVVVVSPVDAAQRIARPLHPGEAVQLEWQVPRSGRLAAIGLLLGNYANTADGDLMLQACAGEHCQDSGFPLRQSLDNRYLELVLAAPLDVQQGQSLQVRAWTRQASQPVALWLDGTTSGAVRIAGFGPTPTGPLDGHSPALMLVYAD